MQGISKESIIGLHGKGSKYADISKQFEVSLNTVKSICYRSKKCCKQCGKKLKATLKVKPRTFCCNKCRANYWNSQRRIRFGKREIQQNKTNND